MGVIGTNSMGGTTLTHTRCIMGSTLNAMSYSSMHNNLTYVSTDEPPGQLIYVIGCVNVDMCVAVLWIVM